MIADISLLFDVALAALLAVMIFYAVRLNKRIANLRDGEGELQQMIAQFNESSLVAQESARALKAAGTEAEFGVKAAIAKGMALRNDLEKMLDQAELLVDRIDDERYRVPAAPDRPDFGDMDRDPSPPRSESARPAPPRNESARPVPLPGDVPDPRPAPRNNNIKPFAPPIRSADEVVRSEAPSPAPAEGQPASAALEPRTEAERHLLEAIRAAKQGVA